MHSSRKPFIELISRQFTDMRSPIFSLIPMREEIDVFCHSPTPDNHLTRHTPAVSYVWLTTNSTWSTVRSWLARAVDCKRSVSLSRSPTTPSYFCEFRWRDGYFKKSMTRQDLMNTLLKLAERWDEVMILKDDLDDAKACLRGDEGVPGSLVFHTDALLKQLTPILARRSELLLVLGQEVSYLTRLELAGKAPSAWREHPFALTLDSLVPSLGQRDSPEEVGLWAKLLPSYPDSRPRWGGWWDMSDWMFRVVYLLSTQWTTWCEKYDCITPAGLLEDAKATLDQWQEFVHLPSPTTPERVARSIVRFNLSINPSQRALQRRLQRRRVTEIRQPLSGL